MSQTNLFIANSTVAVEAPDQMAVPVAEGGKLAFAFVWLFTIACFGRPEDYFRIPFHFQLIFATAAALAYMGALVSGRARFLRSRVLMIVLLLTAWFTLGVAFAYWRSGSFEVLTGTWLKTALLLFLLTQTLTTVGRIRKLLWGIILSELIVTSASVLLQGGESLQGGRVAGVSQYMLGWNYFGIAFSITLPYMAALYLSHRSLVKTALLATSAIVMMRMLMLTASRGGFLNVVFSMVLTWVFVLRRSRRGQIAGLLLVLCLVAAVVRAPGVFWVRLQTIWSAPAANGDSNAASAEESTQGREVLLQRAIMYTMRFPIFGVGIGNFPIINGKELRQPGAWVGTHNTFTQVSSETGIPGLALFLWLLVTLLREVRAVCKKFANDVAKSELRWLALATLVSLLSFAFAGFFAHLAYEFEFYYVAGIAAGLWTIARQSAVTQQLPAESRAPLSAMASKKWPARGF